MNNGYIYYAKVQSMIGGFQLVEITRFTGRRKAVYRGDKTKDSGISVLDITSAPTHLRSITHELYIEVEYHKNTLLSNVGIAAPKLKKKWIRDTDIILHIDMEKSI